MTYEVREESRATGVPYELYEFAYGPNAENFLRYTNADRDLTLSGQRLFKAIPIQRQSYKSSGKVEKSNMTVTVPAEEDISILFSDFPPTQPVSLLVRAGHFPVSEPDIVAIWSGRVLSAAKKSRTTEFTCESTIVQLNRPGLRRNFQFGCPLVLYGGLCRADKAAATRTATVQSVDPQGLSLNTDWFGTTDVTKYKNGILSWSTPIGTETRTIREAYADGGISFIGPVRNLEAGDTVSVTYGCNHRLDDCQNLHNNVQNFGGQPWIPTKNPFKYHPFW
jgi:hypothetical protein